MVAFASNGTHGSTATATNGWAGTSVSIAGMRGSSKTYLGATSIEGDERSEVIAYDATINGATRARFDVATSFDLGGGNDVLTLTIDPTHQGIGGIIDGLAYSLAVTAQGNGGADRLWLGTGNDVAYGETVTAASLSGATLADGHDDEIYGGSGRDTLYGDVGSLGSISAPVDTIVLGDDYIDGGANPDFIYGDAGDFSGTLNAATTTLTTGNDELFGAAGADTIYGDGGAGNSIASSLETLNFGDDWINGGAGADTLVGDYGGDLLDTGVLLNFGNDNIQGGAGDDTIFGDSDRGPVIGLAGGNDTINGGAGDDELWGDFAGITTAGAGADRFVFSGAHGNDVIMDFDDGADLINLRSFGITSWEQLLPHVTNVGEEGASLTSVVDLTSFGGGTITIEKTEIVHTVVVDASDFIFAPPPPPNDSNFG